MTFIRLQKIAFSSILKNKMRSFLTSLGIIIGVCSVIVMTGIGRGSQKKIQSSIQAMGTNVVMVMNARGMAGGVSQGAGSWRTLTWEDLDAIRRKSVLIEAASAGIRSSGQIIGGSGNWSSSVEGVDPDYLKIRNWTVASGRMFTEREVQQKKKVCLIGQTVVEQIFADTDPVGQKIRIRNTPFVIIGVLAEKGQNAMGQDQDDIVLAPSKTVLSRLKGGTNLDMMTLSAVSFEKIEAAQEEVTKILREQHKLDEAAEDDFHIRTQSEITEMATSTSQTLTVLLAAVASVSLMVGGIGIMNIMLVSVTERTREIGVRMAIGARKKDILNQFLIEAVTLSLTGGIIGILLAYGGAIVTNRLSSLLILIDAPSVLLSIGFAFAVGVFFGFYPAKKAANLNPIDALRSE